MEKLFQCFCLIGATAAWIAATTGCESEVPYEPEQWQTVVDWETDPFAGKADGGVVVTTTAGTAILTVVTTAGATIPPAAVVAVGVIVVAGVSYVVWSYREEIGAALTQFRDAVASAVTGFWSALFYSPSVNYDYASMVIPTPTGLVQASATPTATPGALDRTTVRERIRNGQCTADIARWIQDTIIGPQCHYDWATFTCGDCTQAANWVTTLDTCMEWRDLQIQCYQQVGGSHASPRNVETHRHAIEVARGHRATCQTLLDSTCGGSTFAPQPVQTPATECEVVPGVTVPLYQIACDQARQAWQCVNPSGPPEPYVPNSRWSRYPMSDSSCQ